MCKYLLDLIGFNVDKTEDYYDSKTKLSIILLSYRKMLELGMFSPEGPCSGMATIFLLGLCNSVPKRFSSVSVASVSYIKICLITCYTLFVV